MRLKEISVGILAGGKSSRMGSNKAELRFKDSSFLEHILVQAEDFSERLISVDDIARYQWLVQKDDSGLKFAEDEYKDFGPVEGIYQILKNTTTKACLVIATDMPYLTKGFFESFVEKYQGEDCMVLKADGKVEPLCSIYARDCLPILNRFRETGIRRPRILFDQVNTRYINIEDIGYTSSVINNINTPGQYQEFVERCPGVCQ